MEEEGEIYDGVRAQYPLSFGKQSKSQTPLEAIHNATRRSAPTSKTANDFPSLSSSSKDWLNSPSGPLKTLPLLLRPSTTVPPPQNDDDDDGEMIGPPPPPPGSDLAGSDSEDDSEQDQLGNRFRIPLSNEIVLRGHTKVVSALPVDHSGSRVLSGSYDYMVRMYGFQGMNARLQSFQRLEPSEGHQVRSLRWSPTADHFLCVTGSSQAKIYDHDGLALGDFVKRDMYIRDLKNSKGHISGLTCGEWHPKTKETILTSSKDRSIHTWDVNDFKSQKQALVRD